MNQLAELTRSYLKSHPGMTQKALAEVIDTHPSNFSDFLAGRKSLGPKAVLKLSRFIGAPRFPDLSMTRFV